MSKWAEVRSFYNEEDQCFCIDAWVTSNDDEEGKVIAKIFYNGIIEYIDDIAKTDEYAQEIIKEILEEHYF